MQMPIQTPLAPPPLGPRQTRSYVGARTGIVMLVVVIVAVLLAGLLPGSIVTARNLAYPQPSINVSSSTTQAHAGDTVQFSVQVNAGTDLTYTWDFGDSNGGSPVADGATMSHTYTDTCQSCTVTVVATDPIHHQATASTTITVAPPAPTASFTFQEFDTFDFCVDFDATASTGENLSYAWDYGDGSTDSGVVTNYCYFQSGTYTVTLTVTDDFNQTAQTTQTVHV